MAFLLSICLYFVSSSTSSDLSIVDCNVIEVKHIEWTDVDAILPFVCALVGISFAIGTVVVVAKNNATAIVKASTRELSYVILIGIILAYV